MNAPAPAPRDWGRALLAAASGLAPRGLAVVLGVEPGFVTARVRLRRGAAHGLRLRFPHLAAEAWDPVVARLEAEPSLLGALLDGELPEAVAAAAGGPSGLVPLPQKVTGTCRCGEGVGRCRFAGAVWRELAGTVDRSPALLLTLRGRSPAQLAAAVRHRTARRGRDRDGGVDAAAAYGAGPRPLPSPPPVAPGSDGHPGWRWQPQDPTPRSPHPVTATPRGPRDQAPLPDALALLAADAAARARDLLGPGGDGGLRLSAEADLARRAARLARDPSLLLMAELAGIPLDTLAELAGTWRHGGAAEVDALYGEWSPPAWALGPARALLATHGRVTVRRNRVRLERRRLELRLGRDELWYLVDVSDGRVSLAGPPAADPAPLVAARLGPGPEPGPGPRAPAAGEQLSLL